MSDFKNRSQLYQLKKRVLKGLAESPQNHDNEAMGTGKGVGGQGCRPMSSLAHGMRFCLVSSFTI